MCKGLLEPDELGITLKMKFEKLYQAFPRAKKWLDWWCTADIQAMLFPSRQRLPLDDPPFSDEESEEDNIRIHGKRRPDLPSTTNGQESMHRVYYLLLYVYTFLFCFLSFLCFFRLADTNSLIFSAKGNVVLLPG